ncbi:MAG TPA: hypothetical protein VGS02_05335 [Acidobacteriaceae bacterium]|nr:hypothetical protein [Acidobacteriaceae bacterium]
MRHRSPLPPLLLSLLFVFALAPGASAQAAGSDYTASMPSVEKIRNQLQGSDPIDTEARQAAVFEYLPIYIRRIKETRDYRGPYSAGEQKLLGDYAQALYAIQQDIKTKHTPDEAKRYQQLEGQYSINNAETWIRQLSGSQANDTYRGAQASLAQTYNQHEAQMQKQMQQDNGQGSLLGGFLAGGGVQSLKPEQKRCLELGGTINQCANPIMGLASGIGNLISGIMGGGGSDTPPPPPLTGVLLVGYYHSRTDLPEIALNTNGGAVLKSCGTLVDVSHAYTLRKSGATVQLVVDNEPDPIVLTLRPDGSLSGPGNIAVKGFIVTGYHDVTTCSRGACSTTSTPIYAPSMQRCTISQLAPQPAPPPPPKPKPGSLAEAVPGNSVATIYGFRVTGPYANSSGMKLDFNDAFVTLDCGQAHINAPYTVENAPAGFIVHVQNGGGAFLLGVAPDKTLRGTGSTTINGKLVSGLNGEVVSFTPHSESCGVGKFAPASNKNTMDEAGNRQ